MSTVEQPIDLQPSQAESTLAENDTTSTKTKKKVVFKRRAVEKKRPDLILGSSTSKWHPTGLGEFSTCSDEDSDVEDSINDEEEDHLLRDAALEEDLTRTFYTNLLWVSDESVAWPSGATTPANQEPKELEKENKVKTMNTIPFAENTVAREDQDAFATTLSSKNDMETPMNTINSSSLDPLPEEDHTVCRATDACVEHLVTVSLDDVGSHPCEEDEDHMDDAEHHQGSSDVRPDDLQESRVECPNDQEELVSSTSANSPKRLSSSLDSTMSTPNTRDGKGDQGEEESGHPSTEVANENKIMQDLISARGPDASGPPSISIDADPWLENIQSEKIQQDNSKSSLDDDPFGTEEPTPGGILEFDPHGQGEDIASICTTKSNDVESTAEEDISVVNKSPFDTGFQGDDNSKSNLCEENDHHESHDRRPQHSFPQYPDHLDRICIHGPCHSAPMNLVSSSVQLPRAQPWNSARSDHVQSTSEQSCGQCLECSTCPPVSMFCEYEVLQEQDSFEIRRELYTLPKYSLGTDCEEVSQFSLDDRGSSWGEFLIPSGHLQAQSVGKLRGTDINQLSGTGFAARQQNRTSLISKLLFFLECAILVMMTVGMVWLFASNPSLRKATSFTNYTPNNKPTPELHRPIDPKLHLMKWSSDGWSCFTYKDLFISFNGQCRDKTLTERVPEQHEVEESSTGKDVVKAAWNQMVRDTWIDYAKYLDVLKSISNRKLSNTWINLAKYMECAVGMGLALGIGIVVVGGEFGESFYQKYSHHVSIFLPADKT